jgi:hypothetical protein
MPALGHDADRDWLRVIQNGPGSFIEANWLPQHDAPDQREMEWSIPAPVVLGGQVMQIERFRSLYARSISFCRAACGWSSSRQEAAEASASPIAVFTAVTLFTILCILQIDLFRDELKALGLAFSEDGTEPRFLSP